MRAGEDEVIMTADDTLPPGCSGKHKDDITGQQDNQEVQEIQVVEGDLAVGELQAERLLRALALRRLLRRVSRR